MMIKPVVRYSALSLNDHSFLISRCGTSKDIFSRFIIENLIFERGPYRSKYSLAQS